MVRALERRITFGANQRVGSSRMWSVVDLDQKSAAARAAGETEVKHV
jgi:hypothetical protein